MAATTQVDANVSEFRLNFTIVSTPLQHFWKAVDPPHTTFFFVSKRPPYNIFSQRPPPIQHFFSIRPPPIQHFRGGGPWVPHRWKWNSPDLLWSMPYRWRKQKHCLFKFMRKMLFLSKQVSLFDGIFIWKAMYWKDQALSPNHFQQF